MGIDYKNLAPYYSIFNTNTKFSSKPESIGGSFNARKKLGKNGIWKIMANGSHSDMGVDYYNPEAANGSQAIELINDNFYVNTTFRQNINNKVISYGGLAINRDKDKTNIDKDEALLNDNNIQAKGGIKYIASEKLTINTGIVHSIYDYSREYKADGQIESLKTDFINNVSALYSEAKCQINSKIAGQAGLRAEYSSLQDKYNLAPRLSMAYKVSEGSQLSMAYGKFYQNPQSKYSTYNNRLAFEEAEHYILQYHLPIPNVAIRVCFFYRY